jgi:hypothetical protein
LFDRLEKVLEDDLKQRKFSAFLSFIHSISIDGIKTKQRKDGQTEHRSSFVIRAQIVLEKELKSQ